MGLVASHAFLVTAGLVLPLTANGSEELILAAQRGDVAQVQDLTTFDNVNGVDGDGATALFHASTRGHLQVAQLLLGLRADPNIEKRNHATAIYNAALFGHAAIARALLDRHADVNHDFDGQLPIDAGAQSGNAEVVELLLQHGARGNHTLPDGTSPLMKSAQNGFVDVVRVLLKYSAKLGQGLEPSGYTALLIAAQNGHARVVALLLAAGDDVTYRTPHGITARRVAEEHGRRDVLEVLGIHEEARSAEYQFVHVHGEL